MCAARCLGLVFEAASSFETNQKSHAEPKPSPINPDSGVCMAASGGGLSDIENWRRPCALSMKLGVRKICPCAPIMCRVAQRVYKQMLKLLLSYRVGKIMVPYRVHSGSHYYGPSNLGYPKSDDNVDNAQPLQTAPELLATESPYNPMYPSLCTPTPEP